MRMHDLTAIALFTALLAAAPVLAQPPLQTERGDGPAVAESDPKSVSDRGGPSSPEKREEVRKKMEALRIWKLTEALKLDEKTAAKFIPQVSAVEQKRRDLMRDNQKNMRDLRQTLSSRQLDEQKLKELMERMVSVHREMTSLREREIEIAKENLTTEQQARYLLFQQEFVREMRGMIEGVRGRGMGMGPGPRAGAGRGGMGQGMGPGPGRPPQ